jgi:hypothetical protein
MLGGSDVPGIGGTMGAKSSSLALGRWRIFEADLWDRDFLDLVEPAYIRFAADGHGEFMFGCVSGSMNCSYGLDSASFTWAGFDEMDETSGDGDADLHNDILTIELNFDRGDEAVLKARRWESSPQVGRASDTEKRSNERGRRSRS